MLRSYTIYTYSERGHSGLQEYVVFEKANFLKKIDFLRGRVPLNVTDVKQFWKKARKHFTITNPPINGFLSNGAVISSPDEMCNLC